MLAQLTAEQRLSAIVQGCVYPPVHRCREGSESLQHTLLMLTFSKFASDVGKQLIQHSGRFLSIPHTLCFGEALLYAF